MHPYTNATAHLYEGDIAFTDGPASRDEVIIYRSTRHPHHGAIFFPQEIVPRTTLMPLPLDGICWNDDVLLPYAYTQRDARTLADALAHRYGLPFGVYDYAGDDDLQYVVNTAFDADEYEDITCYYRTNET